MDIAGAIVVFSFSWWFILLMLLPLKVESPDTPETGHAPSAPVKPYLKQKMIAATILALCISLFWWWAVEQSNWSLESWLGVTSWEDYMKDHPV